MLFNSDIFIFAFMPVALAGFFLVVRLGRKPTICWLILASFVFYSWWDLRFLPVLLVSIAFNYSASELIGAARRRPGLQNALLATAIGANLAALVYYKYLFSLVGFLGELGVVHSTIARITLPLGISFFTFTQIGYLVDVKQGVAKDRGLLNYVLFVTFFPHLIAGPILHNGEMMPQFADPLMFRFSRTNLMVGLCIFVMGLLKKCVLADPISAVVAPGYAHAAGLPMFAAWNVALSYSLQIYFDFSGYSDMAIGLARMFNVRFPLNFNSPYKAASVIEYWQRWHMTLSRYLNLYLYSPIALAITRKRAAKGQGTTRKAHRTIGGFSSMVLMPTMITMALAGIWHGAGLQFLIFGLLHGLYLVINHAWRILKPKPAGAPKGDRQSTHVGKVLLTYFAVVIASNFFRAPSVEAGWQLLLGMAGLHGTTVIGHDVGLLPDMASLLQQIGWLAALYVIVWALPNTQQIMRNFTPALGRIEAGPMPWLQWNITPAGGLALGVATAVAVLSIANASEFLYFQF